MRNLLWIVIITLLLAVTPLLFGEQSQYVSDVLTVVAIYVILAVSADLLVGVSGQISLGHAAFFAIGAYSSAVLTTEYQVPVFLGALAGMSLAALIAVFVGAAVLRLKGYYLAMATLGLTAVVFTLLVGLREITGGAAGLGGIPRVSIFGFSLEYSLHYYYFVLIIAAAITVMCKALTKSAYGRALISIHGDEQTAAALGVNVTKYKISVFVLSCVLAALAGSLFSHHLRFIAPDDFTVAQSIHILVMAFLGGIGSIYGAVVGAATLQLLPEFFHYFKDYEELATGLILVLILAFFPRGIWGVFEILNMKIRNLKSPAKSELKRETDL